MYLPVDLKIPSSTGLVFRITGYADFVERDGKHELKLEFLSLFLCLKESLTELDSGISNDDDEIRLYATLDSVFLERVLRVVWKTYFRLPEYSNSESISTSGIPSSVNPDSGETYVNVN
ncbi:MAG: hypothetical protein HQM12_10430 [SAR324 cluster bacterium]|nr:hypothetical protein [SAR324 cluster bacterium]